MTGKSEQLETGKRFAETEDFEKALLCFGEILGVTPDDEEALFETGKIHYIRKEYGAAAEILERLLRKGTSSRYAALLLGKTYKEMGDISSAIRILESSGESSRGEEYFREMGDLYRESGIFELAEKLYEKFLSLRPEEHETRVRLAQLYNFGGQFGKTRDLLGEYLDQKKPSDPFLANQFLNEWEIASEKEELSSMPRIMLVTLTNRCNLNCPMCGKGDKIWDISPRLKEQALSLLPYLE
ncbi:MAG TPA: tetratricopeptide repeat protein, partial [bacterium]|nr:tetratricopeptide repeat protein [bacterium]